MDPRKFLRMVALGMDQEVTKHPWVWMCSMCTHCTYVCPMETWNKDLKIKFTVQDPCNQIRKSYGDVQADKMRYVVKACVGEENFVDMFPNKSNNYCCGGGGGYLQSGYTEARFKYGKIKFDQIIATGADYCLTPCHNCHAQIHELAHHFGGNYHVTHLWTIIALSLGILAENEREYLGDDLKEVWLPSEPGTPNPLLGNRLKTEG